MGGRGGGGIIYVNIDDEGPVCVCVWGSEHLYPYIHTTGGEGVVALWSQKRLQSLGVRITALIMQ